MSFRQRKGGPPLVMVTAYDYPTARAAEQAGVDAVLVGDSLGMAVLGYSSTVPVTMEDMLHHSRAVRRGIERTLMVVDMPFLSYQVSVEEAVRNAGRLVQEGGADAVKLEGGWPVIDRVQAIVRSGIPVMGHLGLTPQSVHQLGGYKVQGKTPDAAARIVEDAKRLEEAGCFSLVLECVPEGLAARVAQSVSIPVIGIGAGARCDGQVLVIHDLLGWSYRKPPKFVKSYANFAQAAAGAIAQYADDVRHGRFPAAEHTYFPEVKEPVQ
ncbi:MAG: 3-methyl-2-oxobutanoate hydroxymethyltransferase [Alicyclobacillaceae bacterium]|nr:3-methyl-2-oxobutanoate hydroxymethyltransferase [Alicyclobacillaceae bacterium]